MAEACLIEQLCLTRRLPSLRMRIRTRISLGVIVKSIKRLITKVRRIRAARRSVGVRSEGPFQIRRHLCEQGWLNKRRITITCTVGPHVQKAVMRTSRILWRWALAAVPRDSLTTPTSPTPRPIITIQPALLPMDRKSRQLTRNSHKTS